MKWWKKRKLQKRCFHHDHIKGVSWIKSVLINTGAQKMYWCDKCDRTWI